MSLDAANWYKTKKDLKGCVGKPLRAENTSMFGDERTDNGVVNVVGPCAYTNRKWYATVTVENGLIKKVT